MTSLAARNNVKLVPSFYIYTPEGNKVSSIKKAYIKKLTISTETYQKRELTADNVQWKLVVDDPHIREAIETELAYKGEAYCIISFQVHNFGNYAVMRLFKGEKR